MWDERQAIGLLLSACAAELDREPFDDRHMLLHGIARELESLADVLEIEHVDRRSAVVSCRSSTGLSSAYRRVLELPLARSIRTVLSTHLARLEHGSLHAPLADVA